jgi:hypothetical protein
MFLAYLVGVEGQSDRSCQTSIRWSLCSCVSIRGTHLTQNLHCFNTANIISNASNQTFIAIRSSLVIICRRADRSALHFMSWQLCRASWNMVCFWHQWHHCWSASSTASLCACPQCHLHECQGVPFCPHGGIQ